MMSVRQGDEVLVTTGAQNDRYAKLRNKEKSGLRLRNSEKPLPFILVS